MAQAIANERKARLPQFEQMLQDWRRETAETRWVRLPRVLEPTLATIFPDGKVEPIPEYITALEAAGILRCSIRTIQGMCERGVLVEGREWRKICARGARGEYRISRAGVLRIFQAAT
jgi:hypothetical protein